MIELRWVVKSRNPGTLEIAAGFGASAHAIKVLQYREWVAGMGEKETPVWVDVPVVGE